MPCAGTSTSLQPATGRMGCNLSAQGPAARSLANCPGITQEEVEEELPIDFSLSSCRTHLCTV